VITHGAADPSGHSSAVGISGQGEQPVDRQPPVVEVELVVVEPAVVELADEPPGGCGTVALALTGRRRGGEGGGGNGHGGRRYGGAGETRQNALGHGRCLSQERSRTDDPPRQHAEQVDPGL